jgi:hypothetical protein
MVKSGLLNKVLRYGGASIGPIGSAGAQFLLSLVLLRALPQRDFGAFSFLLTASQLSWGLWSAMFCAPLPILFHSTQGQERSRLLTCLFSTNILVAILACPLFAILAVALKLPMTAVILFAAYGSIALLRWFARAYAYANGTPLRTTFSDIAYAAALLVGILIILLDGSKSLNVAYGALLVSAALGLLPFGPDYLKKQFASFSFTAVPRYWSIWKQHSGWSLIGVLTTEATANSHVYIVTAWFGPKAFAPIAASALLIRPINVAMNALVEFERAQMARAIGALRFNEAFAAASFFRKAMIAAWIATMIAVAILLYYAPHALFPRQYPLSFLMIAGVLWMLVAAVRLLRMPESALLQAAGQFRPLALASVVSSGFSVVAVTVLLVFAGVLWSIVGILIGEAIYAFWIFRQCQHWRRNQTNEGTEPQVLTV